MICQHANRRDDRGIAGPEPARDRGAALRGVSLVTWLSVGILGFGVVLRLGRYFADRSLWLDESYALDQPDDALVPRTAGDARLQPGCSDRFPLGRAASCSPSSATASCRCGSFRSSSELAALMLFYPSHATPWPDSHSSSRCSSSRRWSRSFATQPRSSSTASTSRSRSRSLYLFVRVVEDGVR